MGSVNHIETFGTGHEQIRLRGLVADLERAAQDLEAGLATELADAECRDPADIRFPLAARTLVARIGNLRATIAQLQQRF